MTELDDETWNSSTWLFLNLLSRVKNTCTRIRRQRCNNLLLRQLDQLKFILVRLTC